MKKTYQTILKETATKLPKGRHDSSADVLYVVDGMNIAHAAKHSYGGLSSKGRSTSLLFGVPQMIKGLMQLYDPKKVIVCWDGARSAHRLKLWPAYKSHRVSAPKEEQEKWLKQLRSLRILLKSMGIAQCIHPEIEGDDMIALVANKYVKSHRIIIVSRDKDLRQLINKDISVLNPMTKSILTWHTFLLDHSVKIEQYVDYLILVGDTSDDIPGINGIGPARAIKFLKEFESIKAYLKSKKEFSGLIDKENLEVVYKRNKDMIDLNHFMTKYHPDMKSPTFYKDKSQPRFNEAKYKKLCIKYGLKTMLSETFQKPFKDL